MLLVLVTQVGSDKIVVLLSALMIVLMMIKVNVKLMECANVSKDGQKVIVVQQKFPQTVTIAVIPPLVTLVATVLNA